MKPTWGKIELGRVVTGPNATAPHERQGCFNLLAGAVQFLVIVSEGTPEVPWEHVSVRVRDAQGERTPSWKEMCMIKNFFWTAEECVVQYHPAAKDYVNHHPNVLHLWRPWPPVTVPMPPKDCV